MTEAIFAIIRLVMILTVFSATTLMGKVIYEILNVVSPRFRVWANEVLYGGDNIYE